MDVVVTGDHVVGDTDRGSRKRKRHLTSKERKSNVRHSNHYPNLEHFVDFSCNHPNRKDFCCNDVTEDDIRTIRSMFYETINKNVQDNHLGHFMDVEKPDRSRNRKIERKSHNFFIRYHVWKNGKKICICQKLFLSIFSVSQRRVNTIARKMQSGSGIVENRGGDKRSFKNVKKFEAVKKFIASLKGHESHYGRAKSRRIYLSSENNITILWNLYNQSNAENLKVNYKYFSRIFNSHFNIAFGSPATDVCGFCVRTQTSISLCKDKTEIEKLRTSLRVHKIRAKQFFKLMKEKPEHTVSYCFDLQQVQVLPKVPIQDAFYAQQLSFYCFCVTDVDIKKPVFYTWMEHQAKRGSAETSSALRDFLNKSEFGSGIKQLRLFADGCAGQNKNAHMMHMLMLWLYRDAPQNIKSVVLIFPVRGHSYLPADRIFGQIEKVTRSYSTIKTPTQYYDIYSKKGEVKQLGRDWTVYDIKTALTCLKKIEGISAAKRIIIKRSQNNNNILLKTELFYRNDDPSKQFQTLLKRGKKLSTLHLPAVELQNEIKPKKLQSLSKLLVELSGVNWVNDPELTWLQPILSDTGEQNDNQVNLGKTEDDDVIEGAEYCDCNDDDHGDLYDM
ncbi:uncharacterized protein [Diabrotica undecimpunctata]|uniref:uncharacterized protein n=1 Tax=Diabrotica undecimpunctata TaxID=50387 RepID=UPI003B63761B